MTETPNRPPLWQVIDKAWCAAEPFCDPLSNVQTACMIRALRDWLVPEEPEPLGPAGKAHMELRALLTTEADRAERGHHG